MSDSGKVMSDPCEKCGCFHFGDCPVTEKMQRVAMMLGCAPYSDSIKAREQLLSHEFAERSEVVSAPQAQSFEARYSKALDEADEFQGKSVDGGARPDPIDFEKEAGIALMASGYRNEKAAMSVFLRNFAAKVLATDGGARELSGLHDNWCDFPKCLGECNCHLADMGKMAAKFYDEYEGDRDFECRTDVINFAIAFARLAVDRRKR